MQATTYQLSLRNFSRRMFTLLELVIAIVIIAVLSSIALVGYGQLSARASQASIDSTAGSLQRAMSALVIYGETPQEAYEEILVKDLPSGIFFAPADGSSVIVGGVTEMLVQNEEGWTASFIAPRPGRGGAPVIVSSGKMEVLSTNPLEPNAPITVGSQGNQDHIVKFEFDDWNSLTDITVQYCQLPAGCAPSEMMLLTDTVTSTKTRNLHGVAANSTVYATVSTSAGIDSWTCQLTDLKPPTLCELVAN